jgi:NTE family protein
MPLESTDPSPDPAGELALVMTGGGARAAYQVGLLRYLARRFPNLEIPLLTGVSAGAINAAYLGTHTCGFAECVGRLSEIWSTLETQSVLRVGTFELLSKLFGWGFGLLSAGHHVEGQVSMVDTSPLRELLIRVLDAPTGELQGIDENLASGRLRAVALTTLSSALVSGKGQPAVSDYWSRPRTPA